MQRNTDGGNQGDTHMPVLSKEELKFKDLSKLVDVGDLNQDLINDKYHNSGQRHSRFSNRKGRSRVLQRRGG